MKGIGASSGIGMGKVVIVDVPKVLVDTGVIVDAQVNVEVIKLKEAIIKTKKQLRAIHQKNIHSQNEEAADIIEAHIMILEDTFFIDEMMIGISDKKMRAENAVAKTIIDKVKIFEAIEDQYIRERAEDIKDIGDRLVKNILNIPNIDISNFEENVILVGKDITPSQMASLDRKNVKGIVSETGGKTCHTAILSRNMEIPAVLGLKDVVKELQEGQIVVVDGTNGVVEIVENENKKKEYSENLIRQEKLKTELQYLKKRKTVTKDGKHVDLCANIINQNDAITALEDGAEGIGLYRTEFLFMDRDSMPDEKEQFAVYKKIVEQMKGRPVIIRTLDIGGDKDIAYLNLPKEENPFLGYRAIRICLDNKEIFKTQLKAILRASAFGKAKIMFPMVACVQEVIAAKKILQSTMEELKKANIIFDENIEVGIMIEIPSAAITADLIIKEVDFFSIGTNDLTQYTLAVDRMNERVSSIYNNYHPAILRLIKNVIDVSHEAGKITGMCGEFAADPFATILLVGMGLDEFSVNPSMILRIRKLIKSIDIKFAKGIATDVLQMKSCEEIEEYLKTVTDKYI